MLFRSLSGTGGLVGASRGSILENVYTRTWFVMSTGSNIGGLVGSVDARTSSSSYGASKITNVYSMNYREIQLNDAANVGGLIGSVYGDGNSVRNVYATSPTIAIRASAWNSTMNYAGGVVGLVTDGTVANPNVVDKAVALVGKIVMEDAWSKIPPGLPSPRDEVAGRVIGQVDNPAQTNMIDLFAWDGLKMGGTHLTIVAEKPLKLDSVGADTIRVGTNRKDGADLSYDDIHNPLVWGTPPSPPTGLPEVNFPVANWNIAANVLPTIKSSSSTMAGQFNQIPSYIYPDKLKQAADGYFEITSIPELYLFRDDINGEDGDTIISDYANKNIRLMADLDLYFLPESYWNKSINDDDFSTRTDGAANFRGTFDGNGHAITLMEDALFGYLTAATVKNLTLNIPSPEVYFTTALYRLPGIVAKAEDGVTISNCNVFVEDLSFHLSGAPLLTSSPADSYGLIAGELITSTIENSRVDILSTQPATGYYLSRLGGLVGKAVRSDITGSIANVVLDGKYMGETVNPPANLLPGVLPAEHSIVGGLVGEAIQTNIERCYSTGTVISANMSEITYISGVDPFESYAGGLVGKANDVVIKNSYSRADVRGHMAAGGLVGFIVGTSSSDVNTTYATGMVKATGTGTTAGYAGGLVGSIEGSRPSINNSVALNSIVITAHSDAERADRVLGNRTDGNYNRIINNYAWDGMQVFYHTDIAKSTRPETEKTGLGTNLKTLMETVFWREVGFDEKIWSDVSGDPYLPVLNLADDEESIFPWPMYLAYLGAEESQDIYIDGIPKVGNTLVAVLRGELVGKAITYQWYLNGKPVTSATNHTFVIPSSAKVGDRITVIGALGNSLYAAKEVIVISEYEQVEDFVTRLYDKVFNRKPDPQGFAFWVNGLTNRTVSAAQMVDFFLIFSPEIEQMNPSTSVFLDILYEAIFGRAADAEGKAFWTYYLDNGCSRRGIVLQFMRAPEFTQMCADYKVNRGDIPAPNPIDVNLDRTAFIFRQYKEILGRTADFDGLNFWAEKINSGLASIEDVSKELVFSKEFTDKNTNNDQYLRVLYAAFFDRAPDAGGLQSWMDALNGGKTRAEVLDGFVYSPEFTNLKAKYHL